jgi:hypothetical protein
LATPGETWDERLKDTKLKVIKKGTYLFVGQIYWTGGKLGVHNNFAPGEKHCFRQRRDLVSGQNYTHLLEVWLAIGIVANFLILELRRKYWLCC